MGLVQKAFDFLCDATNPRSERYDPQQHKYTQWSAYENSQFDEQKRTPECYWEMTKKLSALSVLGNTDDVGRVLLKGEFKIHPRYSPPSRLDCIDTKIVSDCTDFVRESRNCSSILDVWVVSLLNEELLPAPILEMI